MTSSFPPEPPPDGASRRVVRVPRREHLDVEVRKPSSQRQRLLERLNSPLPKRLGAHRRKKRTLAAERAARKQKYAEEADERDEGHLKSALVKRVVGGGASEAPGIDREEPAPSTSRRSGDPETSPIGDTTRENELRDGLSFSQGKELLRELLSTGSVLREGVLTKKGTEGLLSRSVTRIGILFSNCFVLAVPNGSKNVVRQALPLESIESVCDDGKLTFSLNTNERKYVLSTKTSAAKEAWLSDLDRTIFAVRKAKGTQAGPIVRISSPGSIFHASRVGDTVAVRKLLYGTAEGATDNASLRCDPNALDDSGSGALHYAAKGGHPTTVQLLLGGGANVNLRSSARECPLHVLCAQIDIVNAEDYIACAQMLLENGARANALDSEKNTPAHHVLLSEQRDEITTANANATLEHNGASLSLAERNKRLDPRRLRLLRLLVQHGARLSRKNNRGQSLADLVKIHEVAMLSYQDLVVYQRKTTPSSALQCGDVIPLCITSNMEEWLPDDARTACVSCETVFDWVTRRHHCRSCGELFCWSCCTKFFFFAQPKSQRSAIVLDSVSKRDKGSDMSSTEQSVGVGDAESTICKERVCDGCFNKWSVRAIPFSPCKLL